MKLIKVLLRGVCLILFALAIIQCSKKDDPENPEPAPSSPTTLNDKTSIIKESDTSKVLDYDTLTNILELSADINIANVQAGSIIVSPANSAAPYGFLVKVDEVLEKGSTIKVKTSPVFLEEAFEDLEFSQEFTLAEPASGQRLSTGPTFTISENVDLIPNGGAKLGFTASFQPTFKLDLKIEKRQIKKLSITLLSDFNTQVSLNSGLEGDISLLKKILEKRLKNITLWIPTPIGIPFPVSIGSYITFDVKASGSITPLQLSCNGNMITSNTVSYENSWNNSNSITFQPAFTKNEFHLNGEIKLAAIPGFKLRFYNSDAAYGRISFPIGLNFHYDNLTNPDKKINVFLKADAMMHISNLVDYNTELGMTYEKQLWGDYFVVKKKEGDQKKFEVGVPLDTVLTVLVTDSSDTPREGVKVTFTPEGKSTYTTTTDVNGLAKYAYVPTSLDDIKIYYELAEVKNQDESKVTGSPNFFKLEGGNLLVGNWKAVDIPGEPLGVWLSEYNISLCPGTRTGSQRVDIYTLNITSDSIHNFIQESLTGGYGWDGTNCSSITVNETLELRSGTYSYKYVQSGNMLTVNDQYGTSIIQIVKLDSTNLTLKYVSGDGDILEYNEVQLVKVP